MPVRAIRGFIVALLLFSHCVVADDLRPAFLQLTEKESDIFQVLWKVPARANNLRLSLSVEFDRQTRALSEPLEGFVGGAHLQRWTIQRPGGLPGMRISIDGLAQTSTEVLLRTEYLDGRSSIHRLTPDAPDFEVTSPPGFVQVVTTYLVLGIEHILIGIDHLLFVLVLLMLVRNVRKLLWTITAFTVAHSITLSLAALEVIRIPVPPVEACIALSIVFVATEIIRSQRGQPGLTERRPWIVAFTFGLLHGLGFAAALGEIGLPQTAIPAALLFFNLGVEVGQFMFIGVILALGWLVKQAGIVVPVAMRTLPVYLIGSVAAFWTIERTVGFWS